MLTLGIETSCDETAASLYHENLGVLSNIIYSQIKEHEKFMGVVPEIAARAHLRNLSRVVNKALENSQYNLSDIDAFAATGGPGLIGGVMIGTMYAKTLASIFKRPYIAVNHLEAHALSPKIDSNIEYPYLLLLVSGGHCQFISVNGIAEYKILGKTLDDAVGEAFDKVAKLLNLGYPGGPIIEKYASKGDMHKYKFPLSMVGREGCDMSFSGLKTAVLYLVQKFDELSEQNICDIAASFQYTVGEILSERFTNAIKVFTTSNSIHNKFVIAGGVAANEYLRNKLSFTANSLGFSFHAPKMEYCTDNAAMVAYVGYEYAKRRVYSDLNFSPKAKWSLESLSVSPRIL